MSEIVVVGAFTTRPGKEAEAAEALDAHLASPHIQEVLGRVDELFTDGGEITVYHAVPGGDERKGSLAAHAGG